MRRLLPVLLLLLAAALDAQTNQQTIKVALDATEAPRRIFHSHLTIPATPGPMRLAYARWIPGEHGPTGPITDLVNLKIGANGQRVEWRRDPRDMFVFHVDVPKGASALDVDLSYISPTTGRSFSGAASATPNLAVISWNTLLLFPPGTNGDDVKVEGSIRMPQGWTAATALVQKTSSGDRVAFEPASLTTYIDSPVLIGRYMKVVAIPSGTAPAHRIDLAADSLSALETPATFAADYGRMVAEAGALFGAYPFRKYDWLVTLSDDVAHFGLEHHESSDNRREESTLQKEWGRRGLASLLAHEYAHSWNGKYRRPAIMLSPDYQKPMEGNLLWVYEGLTDYLGGLLATRAGLWSAEDYRENLAAIAAGFDIQPGRTWRPLEDTAVAAQIGGSEAWRNVRRGGDYYAESTLLWLEADSIIRRKTNGRASLDDFLRRFHGGETGKVAVKPYTYDDVIATLHAVAPHDWRAHFDERLRSVSPRAPMAGITNAGWKLVFNDTPNTMMKAGEERSKSQDLTFSLGIALREDGTVRDAILGLPAANAGIGPGMKVIAVNGRRWTREVMEAALRAKEPIELLVENNDWFRTYALDYRAGLRYPHLERDEAKPDTLSEVVRPKTR